MNKINMGLLCLLLAGGIFVSPASAGLFDWLKIDNVVPAQADNRISGDVFGSLLGRLEQLNTGNNIKLLDEEMTDYKVESLKVKVIKVPGQCDQCAQGFYVVKGKGVVRNHPVSDREIVLTYSQLNRMYPYFWDGKIDFFDRWQLYGIYKLG